MNKRLAFLFAVVFMHCAVFSQNVITKEDAKGRAKEFYDRADNDFAFGKLYLADSFAREATREKDNFIDAWLLIGVINLDHLNRYDVAQKAFEKVKLLLPGYVNDIDFQLARCKVF